MLDVVGASRCGSSRMSGLSLAPSSATRDEAGGLTEAEVRRYRSAYRLVLPRLAARALQTGGVGADHGADAYPAGVSTRRTDRLVETLGTSSLSKSQVLRMASTLDEQVAFFGEPIARLGRRIGRPTRCRDPAGRRPVVLLVVLGGPGLGRPFPA